MSKAISPTRPRRQRIRHHYPYMLSAEVLSAEPTHEDDLSSLRDDASCDGHCFLKPLRSFGDGTYLVRVASSVELLRNHGYTMVLNEMQLARGTPWHEHLLNSA